MTISKQAALVRRLYEKTMAGQLDWKVAARDRAFQVSFSSYTVRLVEADDPDPNEEEPDYFIELINEDGDLADGISYMDLKGSEGAPVNDNWWQTLRQIYSRARRTARGADRALDTILKELE